MYRGTGDGRGVFTELLAEVIQAEFGGEVRWRRNRDRLEGVIRLPLVGGLEGVMSVWPDGMACGFFEGTRVIAGPRRDAVKSIFREANARNGLLVLEFANHGRVRVRVKGLFLRGSAESRVRTVSNRIFGDLRRLDRRIGGPSVPPGVSRAAAPTPDTVPDEKAPLGPLREGAGRCPGKQR